MREAWCGDELDQFFAIVVIPDPDLAVVAAAGDSFRCGVIAGGVDPVLVWTELFHLCTIGQVVLAGELVGTAAECGSVSLHRDPKDLTTERDFASLFRIGTVPDTDSIIASAARHTGTIRKKANAKDGLCMSIES